LGSNFKRNLVVKWNDLVISTYPIHKYNFITAIDSINLIVVISTNLKQISSFLGFYRHTDKPVYNDSHLDTKFGAVVDRWFRGSFVL